MTKLPLFVGVAALTLLAGCGEPEAPVANIVATNTFVEAASDANVVVPAPPLESNTVAAAPALNLAPDGLSLVTDSGSARMASFGMARDVAVPMVTAALGKPSDTGHNDDCGQGPMDTVAFTAGVTMFFMEGKFVGWDLDEKSRLQTAAGIGIGSTLRDLRGVMTVSVEESTLGQEFSSGDMGGLLSAATPAGKVTALWAGSTCQFR